MAQHIICVITFNNKNKQQKYTFFKIFTYIKKKKHLQIWTADVVYHKDYKSDDLFHVEVW